MQGQRTGFCQGGRLEYHVLLRPLHECCDGRYRRSFRLGFQARACRLLRRRLRRHCGCGAEASPGPPAEAPAPEADVPEGGAARPHKPSRVVFLAGARLCCFAWLWPPLLQWLVIWPCNQRRAWSSGQHPVRAIASDTCLLQTPHFHSLPVPITSSLHSAMKAVMAANALSAVASLLTDLLNIKQFV